MSILSGFTGEEIRIIRASTEQGAIDILTTCYGLRTDQAKEVKKQADARAIA